MGQEGLWRVPGCTQEVRTWERVLTPPEGFQMLHPTPKTDVPQPLPPEGEASPTLCSCSVAKPRRHPPLPQVSAQCHLPWEASPDGSTQNDNSHSPFSSSSIQTTSSPMPPLGSGLGMPSRPGQPEPQRWEDGHTAGQTAVSQPHDFCPRDWERGPPSAQGLLHCRMSPRSSWLPPCLHGEEAAGG